MSNLILIVDVDSKFQNIIAGALKQNGYRVDSAFSMNEAQRYLSVYRPDLVLLSTKTASIQHLKQNTATRYLPVILMTEHEDEGEDKHNKTFKLNEGVNSYITKPFSIQKLLTHIQVVLRQTTAAQQETVIKINALHLDFVKHSVVIGNSEIDISPMAFRLLHFFMLHPNHAYSRAQLLHHIWGTHIVVEKRTIDVHIRHLRKTLKPWGYDQFIQTVRGVGYRFCSPVSPVSSPLPQSQESELQPLSVSVSDNGV